MKTRIAVGIRKIIRAVYAGSFDPITLGHLDIIVRAAPLFDLVIGVANNPRKRPLIPLAVRHKLVISSLTTSGLVLDVQEVPGLLVDFCNDNDIQVIVRGLRNTVDFEYEFGMAHVNEGLGDVQTIFLPSKGSQTHVSSSVVRELAVYGADISEYVPVVVRDHLLGLGKTS